MDELTKYATQITSILGMLTAVCAAGAACSSKFREKLKSTFIKYHVETQELTGENEEISKLKQAVKELGESERDLRESIAILAQQFDNISKVTESQNKSINNLSEIITLNQTLIENHITGDVNDRRDLDKTLERLNRSIEASEAFTKIQCGEEIREIFNKYNAVKKLPPDKWQYVESLHDVYITKLRGNSLAGKLLKEMETWDVDNGDAED